MSLYRFLTRRWTLTIPSIASIFIFTVVTLSIFYLLFINLAKFLSPEQLYGQGVLVVGGWLKQSELEQAYEVYQRGNYDQVLAIGMIIEEAGSRFETHAERGAWYLRKFGLPEKKLIILPVPQSEIYRTFVSSLTVRNWLQKQGQLPKTLDIASSYAHSRRTRIIYRQAFSNTKTKIGIIAVPNPYLPLEGWWRQSHTAKTVISEFAGWLQTICCFDPRPLEQQYGRLDGNLEAITEKNLNK